VAVAVTAVLTAAVALLSSSSRSGVVAVAIAAVIAATPVLVIVVFSKENSPVNHVSHTRTVETLLCWRVNSLQYSIIVNVNVSRH
jgi:hypothetical protein